MSRVDEAAEYMTAEELYQYGRDSRFGTNGRIQMPTTAVKYLKAAAAKGSVPALYELGELYLSGEGTEKDTETARYWFERAAGHGSKAAKKALRKFPKRKDIHAGSSLDEEAEKLYDGMAKQGGQENDD